MTERDVALLDARGFLVRNDDGVVDERFDLAAVAPEESRRHQTADGTRAQESETHVRRVAARADADGDVACDSERFDLTLEDVLVAVVVGDGGQNRSVRRERDGWPAAPLALIAPHELSGQVLRVGGAAAVAEEEHLVAARDGTHAGVDELFERFENGAAEAQLELGAVAQPALDVVHEPLSARAGARPRSAQPQA